MKRTTRSRILRLLKEAPSTSPEVGSILFPKMKMRESMRLASAHLCDLRTEGKIKVIGKVHRLGCTDTKVMANLYKIL
jgi:hypothetical protein